MRPLASRAIDEIKVGAVAGLVYSTLFLVLLYLSYLPQSEIYFVSHAIIFLNPAVYIASYLTSFGSILYKIGVVAFGWVVSFFTAAISALAVRILARVSPMLLTIPLIAIVIWGGIAFR